MELHRLYLFIFVAIASCDQDLVNNLSRNLNIRYYVLDNFPNTWITFEGKLTFENQGTDAIPVGSDKPWTLYFCHTRLFEPERIRPNGAELGTTGLKAFHVNGCMHKIEPTAAFVGIAPGATLEIPFRASDWEISRTDVMPNWYVLAPGVAAQTVESTAGYSLDWVGAFDTANKWKRQPDDTYNPYSGADRLAIWSHADTGVVKHVIPTPVSEALDTSKTVNIYLADWVVVYGAADVQPEAMFLADKLGTVAVGMGQVPYSRYILMELDNAQNMSESYTLATDQATEIINIKGKDRPGVFYGAQTLLSLANPTGDVPHGDVTDYPRFGYRGMHADVGRNFRPKEDILKLLDTMSMYKLNKFHFHITDDEGWRLEIPGIPELTEVGSRRCHDDTGDTCIMPQLGSPPGLGSNDGSGFYSIDEYREILQYADARHIQVIPEFDMPGHGHAAVNAMLARYRKYKDTNMTVAEEFLLSEMGDTSSYLSVQYFTDNAMNPCIESTYTFVRHLVVQIVAIHAGYQDLKTFNFGGDEVPSGAWINSTACMNSVYNSTDELKQEFVMRVAAIVNELGLDLAGWEDGFTRHEGDDVVPIDIEELLVDNVYAYFWNNVWEWGNGERAYLMANAGYKAIMSQATHLYFDHPHEPDPEERGYYWATRFAPTKKTFGFMPDSLYENIEIDRMGNPLDKETICLQHGCTPLEPGKEANIMGMQGHLWSETVRTSDDFDYMVYTRMLAVAERAWHKASWESITDVTEREIQRDSDWQDFANTLGYKELARLDDMGVMYTVLPPGVSVDGTTHELVALAEFPGLPIWYRFTMLGSGTTWCQYRSGTILDNDDVCANTELEVVTRSANSQRQSRLVVVDISALCAGGGTSTGNIMQVAPQAVILTIAARWLF